MKKRILVFLLACLLALALVGCNNGETPSAKVYKVSFVQSGYDTVVVEVEEGKAIDNSKIPTPRGKTGYTVKWEDVDLSNVTQDITVNAVETANTYKITFDLVEDGATLLGGVQNPMSVTFDSAFTLPTASCDGLVFLGWKLDGEAFTSGTYTIADDVTLVADWDDESLYYTITFRQEGQDDVNVKVRIGETISNDRIPSPVQNKPGYTISWDVDNYTDITESCVVGVVERPNNYTVTLIIRFDDGKPQVQSNVTVTFDSAYADLLQEEITGYIGDYVFFGYKTEGGDDFTVGDKWTQANGLTLYADLVYDWSQWI